MAASQSSFGAQTYGHGEAPDRKTFWFSLIAVLGCFVLFIAIMFVAYLPQSGMDSSGQTEVVQARLTRLAELRAKEATAADNYSWVNQPQQVVRIPIERAMALLPTQVSNGQITVPAAVEPVAAPAAEPAGDGAQSAPAADADAPAAAESAAEQPAADDASAPAAASPAQANAEPAPAAAQ